MAALFVFGLVTMLITVLNNAYSEGSTLYDSTIFETIIWRSGWALKPAPVMGSVSFLNIHFSPINYLPNAASYLFPFDRMTYYGIVYGCAYGALLVLAFRAFRGLAPDLAGIAIAAAGALMFYLSGPVSSGAWEPHQEIASALFTIAFFLALAGRRHRTAVAMLVLNATVREDCGLLLALPLLGLWLCNRWTGRSGGLGADRRKDRRRLGIVQVVVLASALLAVNDRGIEWLPPLGPAHFAEAWLPQPDTGAAPIYRAFEARLKDNPLGTVRASCGALALYPYSFPVWWQSQAAPDYIGELRRTDTIFWFDDDRDQSRTNEWLDYGDYPYYFRVIGTRLRLASRKHLDRTPALAGAIEPMKPD
jgi:hypothetical protein